MEKSIYLLLTLGDDGIFVMDSFKTFESAKHAMELNISIQNELEGKGKEVSIDTHAFQRLSVPTFHFRDEDILNHTTFWARDRDTESLRKTDRFIVKSILK